MGISKSREDLRLAEEGGLDDGVELGDVYSESGVGVDGEIKEAAANEVRLRGDVVGGVQSVLERSGFTVEPEAKSEPDGKPKIVIHGEKEVPLDGRWQKFVLRDFSYGDGTGYEGHPARLWVAVDDDGKIVDLVSGLFVNRPPGGRDGQGNLHPDLDAFWEGKKFGRLRRGRVVYDKNAQTINVHLPVRRGDALNEEALDEGFYLQGARGDGRNVKMLSRDFHERFVRPLCPDDEDDNPFVWAARRAMVAKGYLAALKLNCCRGEASDQMTGGVVSDEAIDEIYQDLARRRFNVVTGDAGRGEDTSSPKVYELNRHNQFLCGKIGRYFRMRRKNYGMDTNDDYRADLMCFVLECGEFLTPSMFDDLKVQNLLDRMGVCFAQGLNVARMVAVFKQAMGGNGGFADMGGVGADADREVLLQRSREALIFTLETVGEVFGGYNSIYDRWFLVEDFDLNCGFDVGTAEGREVMLLLAKRAGANFANAAAIFHKCRETAGFEDVSVFALADFATEAASCFPGDNFNVDKVISWAAKYVAAMDALERSCSLQLLAGRLHSGTYVYREAAFNGLSVEDYELRDADEVKAELAKRAGENVRDTEESAQLRYERAVADKRRGVYGVVAIEPRDYRALADKAASKVGQLAAGLVDNVRYLPGSAPLALPVSSARAAVCAFSREKVVNAVLRYRDSRSVSDREKILFFRCIEPFLPEFAGNCPERIAKIVRGLAGMRTVEPDFLSYLEVVGGGDYGFYKNGLCRYFRVARNNGDVCRMDEQDDYYHKQLEDLLVEILTMTKEGLIELEDALEVLEWISEVPDRYESLAILDGRMKSFKETILKKCYPFHYGPDSREELFEGDAVNCLQSQLSMAKLLYVLQMMEVLLAIRDYAAATGAENLRSLFMRLFANGRRRIVCEKRDDFVDYDEVYPCSESGHYGSGDYRRPILSPAKLKELFDEGLLDRVAFEAGFDDLKAAWKLKKDYDVFAYKYGFWLRDANAVLSDWRNLPAFLARGGFEGLLLSLMHDGQGGFKDLPLVGGDFGRRLVEVFDRNSFAKVRSYTEGRWALVCGDTDFYAVLREAELIAGDGEQCTEVLKLRLGYLYDRILQLLAEELQNFAHALKNNQQRVQAFVDCVDGSLRVRFVAKLQKICEDIPGMGTVLSEISELFGSKFEAMCEKVIDDVRNEIGDFSVDAALVGRMCFSVKLGECLSGGSLPGSLASASRLVLTAVFDAQAMDGAGLLREASGLVSSGAENGGQCLLGRADDFGAVALSGHIETVRETVRRIAVLASRRLEVLSEALRRERIKAFGMLPVGGKIHLAKDVDDRILQRILCDHGLLGTSFWVDGSKCVVCPAVPSSGEFVAFLQALAAQGLLKENQATFQLCAVPRLDAHDGAIVGGVMMLCTKKPYPVAEGLFETSHDSSTGRRLLIHDDGGYMAYLPFMPRIMPQGGRELGRTDVIGRIAFSDAGLWQFLRTMHRDKDGGIFESLWAEFVERYVAILAAHGMSDVLNDDWILPGSWEFGPLSVQGIEARAKKGRAIHFATLECCTDAAFKHIKRYEETGEMSGVVYDVILLCNEMQERMRAIQARILGSDEFKEERRLLLGSEEAIPAEEFHKYLQKA